MTQDIYWFRQHALRPVGSVGDFIPEPRCSKSVVGLQTRRRKEGVYKRFGRLRLEGSPSELGGTAVARGWYRSSESELEQVDLG